MVPFVPHGEGAMPSPPDRWGLVGAVPDYDVPAVVLTNRKRLRPILIIEEL
jgi:hypothetical protein